MIYGANGYSGELIAREARRRGLKPVLAGRSAERIALLAQELNSEHQAFALADASGTVQALAGMALVLATADP